MYLEYFGFDEPPFSITPDPKFVFLSEKHQESLAHLLYGITRGGGAGFVQLTGEVGTGKTTISRLLLEQIPKNTNIALILNPNITPLELLENICKEFKISLRAIKGKLNAMVDKLNEFLLMGWSKGENTVIIIDEAQNLPRDTLEQLRLLTNLETDKQKLMQIILIGQPELRTTMRRNDLRQLAQRVTARYHLMPLDAQETYEYIKHRLKIAGGDDSVINGKVAKKIHSLTAGIPRIINTLSDRALLSAYADDSQHVTTKHLRIAAKEVLTLKESQNDLNLFLKIVGVSSLVMALSVLLLMLYQSKEMWFANTMKQSNQITIATGEDTKSLTPVEDDKFGEAFVPASDDNAWQELYRLWDAQLEKSWHKPLCPSNNDTGMDCLRRQGNLAQISKLNHPTLLLMRDNSLVLLSALKGAKIGMLNKKNQTQYIDKSWLEDQWLGTYFIVWSMPGELLIENSPGQLQQWALEMANTISKNNINKNQLKEWIVNFQNNQGLLPDGIIGSETQMALSLNAYNGPTLN